MNKKDITEIGLHISTLMSIILDEDAPSEEIANAAISFCIGVLKDFPLLHEFVDEILDAQGWDEMIAWQRWKKANIRKK